MAGDVVNEERLAALRAQGLSVGEAVRALEDEGLSRDDARRALAADPAWTDAVEAQDRLFAEVDRLNAAVTRSAKVRDAEIPTPHPRPEAAVAPPAPAPSRRAADEAASGSKTASRPSGAGKAGPAVKAASAKAGAGKAGSAVKPASAKAGAGTTLPRPAKASRPVATRSAAEWAPIVLDVVLAGPLALLAAVASSSGATIVLVWLLLAVGIVAVRRVVSLFATKVIFKS